MPLKTAIASPIISPAPLPTPIKTPVVPLGSQSVGTDEGKHAVPKPGEAFSRWLDLSDDPKKQFKPDNEESELKGRELFAGNKQEVAAFIPKQANLDQSGH